MKPTQRHTKSRKRIRRGAIKLKPKNLAVCPKCKKLVKPHTACAFCGTYKKKEVIKIKLSKAERKVAAKKVKEEKRAEVKKKKTEKKEVKK